MKQHTMFDNLIKNMQRFLQMSEEELNYFLPTLEYRVLKKNEFFIRAGESADYVGYIDSGLMRYYYVTREKEHTTKIFFPNEWAGDYTSFLQRKPAMLNITALEDTVVYLFYYEAMQKAYDRFKTFERLGRLIAESLFIELENKSASFIIKTPEERYIDMISRRPEIIAKIPLKYISSMLGIQPESLSRIRRRMQKNK
ncbi:MAG: Crp/Fnr family transcriptional regulator [Chitinophagaceae bacterium]|nr:Crp/Fnr family transcriptional regulator [Chitinophagaceae bacterium]